MPAPGVSVVVATRDRPQLLRRALEAIVAQEYPGEVECVVVFDQSEPQPLGIEAPEGRTIRVIVNERTPGLAGARNSGALAATGALVAFCDDDDIWHPSKLARQVEVLEAHPEAVLVATGIRIHYRGRRVERRGPSGPVVHADLLVSRRAELHPSSFLMRRDVMLENGMIDEGLAGSYGEDYEWLLRLTRRGPVWSVPSPLVDVFWHDGSWFAARWSTIAAALSSILDRYPEIRGVPKGLARIYGQIAFAHAARGDPREARRWIRKTLATDWLQPRGYLALAVTLGVPAGNVLRLAHRVGRGI